MSTPGPLFRPPIDDRPSPLLSMGPAETLVIDPQFMEHVLTHWLLNRPAYCRWCPHEEGPDDRYLRS
jgi:hypothetical protein